MKSLKIKLLHWIPRMLGILTILFVSLFALDAFDECCSVWDKIIAFLMHMIPSFVLIIFLIIAWKYEFIGGILFILVGIIFAPIIFNHNLKMNNDFWMSFSIVMTITFPFILTGILFIISHYQKKKVKV